MTWWNSQQSIECCAYVPLHPRLPAQLDAARAVCEAGGIGDTAEKLRGLDPAVRAWWRHLRGCCCLSHGLCTLHWGYNKSSELKTLVVDEVKDRAGAECQPEAASAVNIGAESSGPSVVTALTVSTWIALRRLQVRTDLGYVVRAELLLCPLCFLSPGSPHVPSTAAARLFIST